MRNRNLDNFLKINKLFSVYGKLLTDKQKNIVSQYYQEDFSLSEISENLAISRQAVHDTLKKSEELLLDFENKLSIVSLIEKNTKSFNQIADIIKSLYSSNKERFSPEELKKMEKIITVCEEGFY